MLTHAVQEKLEGYQIDRANKSLASANSFNHALRLITELQPKREELSKIYDKLQAMQEALCDTDTISKPEAQANSFQNFL